MIKVRITTVIVDMKYKSNLKNTFLLCVANNKKMLDEK